jgi:hypothetical protein
VAFDFVELLCFCIVADGNVVDEFEAEMKLLVGVVDDVETKGQSSSSYD